MRGAYGATSVNVAKTQAQIRNLLIKHKATGVQFTEDFAAEQFGFVFGHVKKTDNAALPMIVKMMVRVWPESTPSFLRKRPNARDQRERQVWRALYHYLKSQLEAVEFGLRTFEDTFLSDIVVADGRTIGDVIKHDVVEGRVRLAIPSKVGAG